MTQLKYITVSICTNNYCWLLACNAIVVYYTVITVDLIRATLKLMFIVARSCVTYLFSSISKSMLDLHYQTNVGRGRGRGRTSYSA